MEQSFIERNEKKIKVFLNIIQWVFLAGLVVFVFYGIRIGIFTSEEKLTNWISGFGIWAPLILTLYTALQVFIPMLPGGSVLVISPILFGPIRGFLFSYTGIILGSVIAFWIAKRYGPLIMSYILNEKNQKYFDQIMNSRNFARTFALMILLPGPPDDYITYLAGSTNMSFGTFISIILPCKVPLLLVYSYGISSVFKLILQLAG
jgi:uncharacterized membrane protein YdjX (TVP38/TMEM64 family)